jgi:hypothetical protein
MSEPGFGQPAEPADWPFDQLAPNSGCRYMGTDRPSAPQLYAEWHHDETADARPRGYPQDSAPPIRWPRSGTYVPQPEGQPAEPGLNAPRQRREAGYRRAWRRLRRVTIIMLLAAVTVTVTVITFPRDGSGTLAGVPGTSATSGTGVMTAGGQAPAQMPVITMKQAERVASRCRTAARSWSTRSAPS